MRVSNRDLLLVTVIVALATGWWVDRSRLEAEIEKSMRESEEERKAVFSFYMGISG
jgi:hypothetical protein